MSTMVLTPGPPKRSADGRSMSRWESLAPQVLSTMIDNSEKDGIVKLSASYISPVFSDNEEGVHEAVNNHNNSIKAIASDFNDSIAIGYKSNKNL